jgi:hypothetical protein
MGLIRTIVGVWGKVAYCALAYSKGMVLSDGFINWFMNGLAIFDGFHKCTCAAMALIPRRLGPSEASVGGHPAHQKHIYPSA